MVDQECTLGVFCKNRSINVAICNVLTYILQPIYIDGGDSTNCTTFPIKQVKVYKYISSLLENFCQKGKIWGIAVNIYSRALG